MYRYIFQSHGASGNWNSFEDPVNLLRGWEPHLVSSQDHPPCISHEVRPFGRGLSVTTGDLRSPMVMNH